jgi:alpha-ketoglutarate-dependent taurine dioxygenase
MTIPNLVKTSALHGDLKAWMEANHHELDTVLADTGVILFRGLDVSSSAQSHDLAAVLPGPLTKYLEGASPRTALGGGVYTSTDYASNLVVSMHNELSYIHRWPGPVAFHCRRPSTTGGQTALADSRAMLRGLRERGPTFSSSIAA